MKTTRRLSCIFMVLCLVLLCACSDSRMDSLSGDFKTNKKYLFHGLEPGISEEKLCKKEKISYDTWQNAHISDSDGYHYLDADNDLYGFGADKVYNKYRTYNGTYYSGSTSFYFTNEKKFLKACKELGDYLEKNYGKPDYNQINGNEEKYTSDQWNALKNPPDLSAYADDGSVSLSDYEKEHDGKNAVPAFWWGDNQKGTALKVTVFRNPICKKEIEDKYQYSAYAYSFIEITVYEQDVDSVRSDRNSK